MSVTFSGSPARGTFPGFNGAIALTCTGTQDFDIRAVSPRGGRVWRLTDPKLADGGPAWNTGGEVLLFRRDKMVRSAGGDREIRSVWKARATSGRLGTYQIRGEDADWSPRGNGTVVLTRGGNAQSDIYTQMINGSNLRRLTDTPDFIESQPVWSPSGNYVVFVREPVSAAFPPPPEQDSELVALHLRTKEEIQLTDNVGEWERSPDWAPDGESLAFTREADFADNGGDIFTMSFPGATETQLTDTEDLENSPSWAPNGTRIAFARSGPTPHESDSTIWSMRIDGSDQLELTAPSDCDDDGNDQEVAWRPRPTL